MSSSLLRRRLDFLYLLTCPCVRGFSLSCCFYTHLLFDLHFCLDNDNLAPVCLLFLHVLSCIIMMVTQTQKMQTQRVMMMTIKSGHHSVLVLVGLEGINGARIRPVLDSRSDIFSSAGGGGLSGPFTFAVATLMYNRNILISFISFI